MTVETMTDSHEDGVSIKQKKPSTSSNFMHSNKLMILLIVSVVVMFFVLIAGFSVVLTKVELLSSEKDLMRMDLRELRSKLFSNDDDAAIKYFPKQNEDSITADVGRPAVEQIKLEGDNSVIAATTSTGHIRQWQTVYPFSPSCFRFHERDGSIRVLKDGYYMIYAQLYFQNVDDLNTLSFNVNVDGKVFLYCKNTHPKSTCSVMGVKKLDANQRVSVTSTFPRIDLKFRGGSSSFGIVRL